MKKLIILSCFVFTGCASIQKAEFRPYVEMGLSTQITKSTDYWIQNARSWQCDDPGFQGSAGYETKNKTRIFLHHESFVSCGTLNAKPEVYSNSIRIVKKWGGH